MFYKDALLHNFEWIEALANHVYMMHVQSEQQSSIRV